ncbi:MAG: ATP-binding cassette domain-containing protein, partial [Methanoregulaceae archaeon]|nr:ATP-binding cassette domain-containing protein [Methanoregulaceae archaeon]
MKPLITVENLCMDFDGKRVLDNISFEIGEGEVLGIIGRSGAGKTVLMHLIRGVEEPPTSGSIIYHIAACASCEFVGVGSAAGSPCPRCGGAMKAHDVDFWDEENSHLKRQIMRSTAIMFQRTFALYGNDRVIENVIHALDDIEYPQEKCISRAADLLDQVRLSHRMMHIARDLSGGEKQRVVLARQLAKEPFLLFADEPTGTLDPQTAHLVHNMLIEAANTNNMGMVVTSHFSQVIEDVADRAMLLDDGKVVSLGSPTEVINTFMEGLSDTEKYETPDLGENILIARDVYKKYISVDRGVVKAVNGVTFEVAGREIFGIIGKSGAGKTTLSRIISGIIE